jgi:C4-dicarboxylate-specific signal transduction histidine kinase
MGDEFQLGNMDSHHWIALSTRSFKIQGEQHTVLIYEDVTERKQFEARDRRLRTELANVSRLTTAGEMASGLAHELTQPLTAISHNCHSALLCLREANVPDAELLESISEIYQQTQRAGSIVRSLRQLARHDSGSFESTNINELVEETIRLTKPEAIEKGVDVRLRLADDLPEPLADPVQIQQVLVNLERNSVEAMGQGDGTSRSLTISTMIDQNTNIRVSVHDTGPGLTPGIKDKLFTAFQTTKSDGMGLGLSISRSIVEAHGGRLWFDQNVAAGTTFHFSLPVTEEVL